MSGTVLYEDKGRLSVRDADLEPKKNKSQTDFHKLSGEFDEFKTKMVKSYSIVGEDIVYY